MSVGVHDFEIPHGTAQPTRDMVIIRIPFPPDKIGSIVVPDMARDIMQHNVQAGRIVSMGPLAFQYKDGTGLSRQEAAIGDWVVIRPFAGTLMTAGRINANSGYRYISSFQDVLAVLPAADMPDPSTLLWESAEARKPTPADIKEQFPEVFADTVRERVTYKK